jgi:phospholipase C
VRVVRGVRADAGRTSARGETRREFLRKTGASVAGAAPLGLSLASYAQAAEPRPGGDASPIRQWVVLMFENRSFDSLLGHLPHIDAADGIRDREIVLPYPGGSVRVTGGARFDDPSPDPGEAYPNINAQLWGKYIPETNAGKAAVSIFPDFMSPPFNVPPMAGVPTMDGFANDFYWNYRWEEGREPSAAEMESVGRMFTPESAPVINTLAREYAVFTRWFCEVPTCTFPNRTFYHAGTSRGRIDNEAIVDYSWDNDLPNLFSLLTHKGVAWKAYVDPSQIVPGCSINLGGLWDPKMWREHTASRAQFFADAESGSLPPYSWVEPNMLFGELDDYHPPTDIRSAEQFLARVYNAVRNSPQWESTALVVLFDEHGGCFDHVPPPAAPIPDDSRGADGFAFDRFGLRIPAMVISAYTARETVVRDTFHTTTVLRTLRERFDLGPALTRRDAAAPLLDVAFNRAQARTDRPIVKALPFTWHPPTAAQKKAEFGDEPSPALLAYKIRQTDSQYISALGQATLRNVARFFGMDPSRLPANASAAQAWLEALLWKNGRFDPPSRPR